MAGSDEMAIHGTVIGENIPVRDEPLVQCIHSHHVLIGDFKAIDVDVLGHAGLLCALRQRDEAMLK